MRGGGEGASPGRIICGEFVGAWGGGGGGSRFLGESGRGRGRSDGCVLDVVAVCRVAMASRMMDLALGLWSSCGV